MFKRLKEKTHSLGSYFFRHRRAEDFWKIVSTNDAMKVYLMAKGVDMNYRDELERTFLYKAVEDQLHNSIDALITLGSDVNAVAGKPHHTPLYNAVIRMDKRTVKLLIEAGANPFIGKPSSESEGYVHNVIHIMTRMDDADTLDLILGLCKKEYMDYENLRCEYNLCKKWGHIDCLAVLESHLKL